VEELFEVKKNCLAYGDYLQDDINQEFVNKAHSEIRESLEYLSTPEIASYLTSNAKKRLKELMWSEANIDDVNSLRTFFTLNFPL
jgi:site-specific DNA-adenine methylase